MSAERDFKTAAARYRRAQAQLEASRVDLHQAMRRARADGMTYAAIAEELGVSRQRAMEILKG